MHYTPKPPVLKPPDEYIVGTTPDLAYRYLDTCPRAQTLVAYSLTHQSLILYSLPCRTWSCRMCAETKIKKLANDVKRAEPNRLLTLTVDPTKHLSPREAWEATRKQVPILIRRLRKRFGEIEYLRVTEVTKNGWPHYHLLIRSGFLPHAVVKAYWSEMTGARIVDLRQVKRSFSAYTYLVKYLSKLHKLEWTERHVSVSRGFAPKDDWVPDVVIETAEPDFINTHPAYVLMERYPGQQIIRLTPNTHLVLPLGEKRQPAAANLKIHEPAIRGDPESGNVRFSQVLEGKKSVDFAGDDVASGAKSDTP